MTDEVDVAEERWRSHYRADDGWMHCTDADAEERGPVIDSPNGRVVEIRCKHLPRPDPLRTRLTRTAPDGGLPGTVAGTGVPRRHYQA